MKLLFNLTAVSLILFALSSFAQAETDFSGSFRGIDKEGRDQRIDMVIRSLSSSGRPGSYVALLFEEKPVMKVAVYQIDPTREPGFYKMIPLGETDDGGAVGINDPNPTLEMNIKTLSDASSPVITIGDAHSDNKKAFNGPMIFDGAERSDLEWRVLEKGNYKRGQEEISIKNTLADGQDEQTLNTPSLSGNFIFRLAAPMLYSLSPGKWQ